MLKSLIITLSLIFSPKLFALGIISEKNDSINHHRHRKNEIAISNAPVYFIKEKIVAYGLHMHYIRSFAKTKYGMGICYERTFGSIVHNTYGIVAAWLPTEKLKLSLSPGLSFEDDHSKAEFALHFDSSYDYEIGSFHAGPAFEVAYDPEHLHMSLGLHIGYTF